MTSLQLGLMGKGGPSSRLWSGVPLPQGSSSLSLIGVPPALAIFPPKRKESNVGCSWEIIQETRVTGLSWLTLLGHPFSPQQSICPLSHLCTVPLFSFLPQFPFPLFLCLSFYHSLISTSPISSSPLGSPLSLSTCIISISIPVCPSLPPRLWSSFGVSVPQFLFALSLRLCYFCQSACVPLSHSPALGLSVPVFTGLPVFLSWSLLLSVSHPLSLQPCPCFGFGLCPCHPVTPVSPTPCTGTSILYPTS